MIDVDLMDIIRTQFKIDMSEIYTALPCKIVNVYQDNKQQKVDVIPSVNNLMKDGTGEPSMQILGIPIIFPGSSTTLISFPINSGDTVMCIFSQRSMDNFKIGNGEPTTANDYRKFSDQDAVAIPGLYPFGKSLNNPAVRKYPHNSNRDLCIAHNIASGTEVNIVLAQSGDLTINTEQAVTVNCKTGVVNATESYTINTPTMNINASTTNWVGNIIHQGNYTMTGQARFNGRLFDTHTHAGVTPGSGTSGGVNGV
ncbi:putative baseplate protein [Pseudomonas phage COT4]|uniref:Baseplate assembly protein n=1 Tax=Pseudomonas phage M5.1 TaxID=2873460 RepID=A0AAE8XEK2_9CAUD|nr:baseplate assembly protein [Pseudomonas phage M5.1]UAV89677.1 baseplate assembly protein [Pseudomonas phage M5.1]UGL61277.1 putative baseplate protein [Pseudomonas phage COT4]